ncbi:MAG: HAMP domain-containing histidine kinase [Candidatus Pacebacteria bacterium]|nr:HAMP domain-containing histidine kinase [Candidatus Paceibacterota bacterium]
MSVFFLLAVYMTYRWGVEIQVALLFYVLIIVMSGILIHARFAFIVTLMVCAVLFFVGHLEWSEAISVNRYWMTDVWSVKDVVMVSVIFMIIATVSWLSNREIEKSLARARNSEVALKAERDSLEVKVQERTKELREAQLEKMTQLNRFAEFGRLSSGLFHDLMSPLSAVTLNMEMVKAEEKSALYETKIYLNKAIAASKRMEDFVIAVRKQIANEEHKTTFSVNEETKQIIEVLLHKAIKANVGIKLTAPENIKIFGSAPKWGQVALNLASNAIDAHASSQANEKKEVALSLVQKNGRVIFTVSDRGVGIAKENLEKIFDPFFTTKEGKGTGLGLYTVKRIVENDFHGTIEVVSEPRKGTAFIINIPKHQNG